MIKLKSISVCILLVSLIGCKSIKSIPVTTPEKGLFKITILYPNSEDKKFDFEYYENTHMPLVAGYLGENLKFYEIDKGISGRNPTDKAIYIAIGYFYCYDVDKYRKSIEQNRSAIVDDVKNYTNIQPFVQINEIKKIDIIKNR